MAILNIANTYNADYLNGGLKLIFTKDKHIVTHGIDFLADYGSKTRGLVPNYELDSDLGFLGKDGWQKMTTNLNTVTAELKIIQRLHFQSL